MQPITISEDEEFPLSTQSSTNTTVNVLMLTQVCRYLRTARHHAHVCSAGSTGYCAVKEMLQSGVPGRTLLIESGDLRTVNTGSSFEGGGGGQCCCLVYTELPNAYNEDDDVTMHVAGQIRIPPTVHTITVYGNMACIPGAFLRGCSTLRSVVVSGGGVPSEHADISSSELFTSLELSLSDSDLILLDLGLSTVLPPSIPAAASSSSQQVVTTSKMKTEEDVEMGGDNFHPMILDLSPLSHVTTIRAHFLEKCTELKFLDLSPLSRVREVHGYFLAGCTGLTEIDLTPLSRVTEVHMYFLQRCRGLKKIDLSPLSQIEEIQWYFLAECSSLTEIDLTPLTEVTMVHDGLLEGCPLINTIDKIPPQCIWGGARWCLRYRDMDPLGIKSYHM